MRREDGLGVSRLCEHVVDAAQPAEMTDRKTFLIGNQPVLLPCREPQWKRALDMQDMTRAFPAKGEISEAALPRPCRCDGRSGCSDRVGDDGRVLRQPVIVGPG